MEALSCHGGTLLSMYRSKELILGLQMGTLEPQAWMASYQGQMSLRRSQMMTPLRMNSFVT